MMCARWGRPAGISRALLNIDSQGVNEKTIAAFVDAFSAFASMAKGAGLPPIDSASVVAPLILPQPTVGHLLADLVKQTHVASVHLACAVICTFFPEASPPPASLPVLNSFCAQFAASGGVDQLLSHIVSDNAQYRSHLVSSSH